MTKMVKYFCDNCHIEIVNGNRFGTVDRRWGKVHVSLVGYVVAANESQSMLVKPNDEDSVHLCNQCLLTAVTDGQDTQ